MMTEEESAFVGLSVGVCWSRSQRGRGRVLAGNRLNSSKQ